METLYVGLEGYLKRMKYPMLNDEPVFIGITDYLDSAINYEVRVWVKPSEFWNTKVRMLENIKREFDKNKINIPYPQMDVHMIKD